MTYHQYSTAGRRMALLCEGKLGTEYAKTATGVLIWCPQDVVAVIDSTRAGQDLERIVGFGRGIPIVADMAGAVRRGANQLVIGVATLGGVLGPELRPLIAEAMRLGCDVVNGLHEMLSSDAELAALAARHGVRIFDLRAVPDDIPCSLNRAKQVPNKRILTVGADCAVGKMCTSLALVREFSRRGLDARFIPTGQTGIMIAGDGLCIDRAISDFAAGAAEKIVLDQARHEWLFIEGQGSIDHVSYSGVTLSLLHGSAPQALVLCALHSRSGRVHDDGSPLLPLKELVGLYETISCPVLPATVVGVSINTFGLAEADAREELRRVERDVGLPTTDPLRFGVENLTGALLSFFGV